MESNSIKKLQKELLEEKKAALANFLSRSLPKEFNEYLAVVAELRDIDFTVETDITNPPPKAEVAATQSGEFDWCEYPIDAIEAYLDKVKAPQERETIVRDLIASGFRRTWETNIPWAIKYGFRYHLKTGTERIKEINGLVGKYEWPDDMFSS